MGEQISQQRSYTLLNLLNLLSIFSTPLLTVIGYEDGRE